MTGSFKSWVTAAVVGLTTLAGGSQADAFFGHSHGSHGSHGSSGGSWGSHGSHGGSWGSHGSWGSNGSHGSHGSWGSHGSHGGYGSSGGYGSHGSGGYASHGSYGSHGSSGGYSSYAPSYSAPTYGAPAITPAEGGVNPPAPPMGNEAPLPAPGQTGVSRDSALLSINVPAEAKVYVNDLATRSTGSDRRYMSRGLAGGREYTYTVRAEIERDGKLLTETKTVKVQGGQTGALNFTFENAQESIASKPLRTALILNVPADAKVFLAGKPTTTTGAVREFATTKLVAGDAWKDYTVRVEIERGGRTLTKEETVSVAAGESRELNFNFDAPEVARVATAEVGL